MQPRKIALVFPFNQQRKQLAVWEYQCYLCWLYGNTNVIFVGCMGIPKVSLLAVREYQCDVVWLYGNTNVIFVG
jgi:hypothetical protein